MKDVTDIDESVSDQMKPDREPDQSTTLRGRIMRLVERGKAAYEYCVTGVWRDTDDNWRVRLVKIVNLTVRGFLDRDLQSKACALTYRMLLAIVPALALIFAIGRGFGFQNILQKELLDYLPSQQKALHAAFGFVDSYLAQASEGLFVGVGIVFLLWTLLSLLSSVEDTFNDIWRASTGRTYWRKITDYLAIFLILPILMICSAGLSLLMSSTLQSIIDVDFLRPAVNWALDAASYVFTALFFTGAYMMIPNAKVRFGNAIVAGAFVALAFQVLQWIFVTGQMYVTKYNAIYGSFSFLPLMLIWLQLVWLFTLIGATLCYASQNAGQFSFYRDVADISRIYRREVTIAVMAIIAKRFTQGKSPITVNTLSRLYGIPVSLARDVVLELKRIGLLNFIQAKAEFLEHPLQPGIDVANLTVGEVVRRLQQEGSSGFIPGFEDEFAAVRKVTDEISSAMIHVADETNIISLNIKV